WGNPDDPATKVPFDITTDFAMFGSIALETLAVLSVFVQRVKRPDAPRPYRCLGYPVVPAVYGIIMFAVWVNYFVTKQEEAWAGVAFITAGAVLYQLLLRRPAGAATT